ncbi:hypothetical protein DICPUDRAFT_52884 [Dictyostelium purpureum]|uniref:Short-chain dehydrogenase/reductase SDR n=1 Tax=Dictyostelium purpureum TaxID=5786 RepID=F0ZAD2_DICPU|nr:uncharacterized protein DICPUDRAFT_52884 [Dictyostelium purpureum]EGC39103.1 hypothetical protein DICPUDRAFT_52884 [Dictyostelium purpureum]|eukprot:XP_003284355.1 hypothetical protein DICPUDRAFT_52884 [Dictyostelium purpureum]
MTDIGGRTYFVTGCSHGIGFELVVELLKQNYRVAATSRNKKSLIEKLKEYSPSLVNDRFLPIEMNLLSESSIKGAIHEVIKKFGSIYCVINNSGYGQAGTVEELCEKEVRENFDVNVFGLINVIKHALPNLREMHYPDPRIICISSIAGYNGQFPGFPIYIATKFAVDGFCESLSKDLEEFNIKVTSVLPGYVRTDFLSSSSLHVPKHPIPEYKAVRHVIETHTKEINQKQQGDPVLCAKAIVEVSVMQDPPLHFFLGKDAVQFAEAKIESMKQQINKFRDLSCSTDFKN